MGGGAPFDQSHLGQGGSEAPAGKAISFSIEGLGGAMTAGAGPVARGRGATGAGTGGSPSIETKTRIVDVPLVLLMAPDTPIVKESSPQKSDLAAYEKAGPDNVTWPNFGGETILIVGFTTLLKRTPRRQL